MDKQELLKEIEDILDEHIGLPLWEFLDFNTREKIVDDIKKLLDEEL